MAVFYTSDTHFNHKNIIKYCNRPFSSVDEMNRTLIDNWNSKVGRTDTVYHLGDVQWGSDLDILNSLRGKKILIVGNHDDKKVIDSGVFSEVHNLLEINDSGRQVILCHYRLMTWNKIRRGSIHLYGHSHSQIEGNAQCTDVGVDMPFTNYSPVTMKEIQVELAKYPTIEDYGVL